MRIIISAYTKPRRDGKLNAKDYPHWKELINMLEVEHELLQVCTSSEPAITPSIKDKMHVDLSFKEICDLSATVDTFISIDSYLPHLWNCHFPERKGIVLFGPSDPILFGYPHNINLQNGKSFLRPNQFWWWEQWDANPLAHVEPMDVILALTKLKRSFAVSE